MDRVSPQRRFDYPGTLFLVGAGIALVLGVVDYVRYFEQRSVAAEAAWAGARTGASEDDATARVSSAEGAVRATLGAEARTAAVAVAAWEHSGQRLLTVEVSLPVRGLLPLLPKPATADASVTVPVSEDATADAQ